MHTKYRTILIGHLAILALVGCGPRGPEQSGQKAPAEPAAADRAAPAAAPSLTRSPAPADARVYFVTPHDGDVVSNPVRVEFAVEGMEVAPAGTAAPHSGHHHLLVDTGLPDLDLPIPADDKHLHFGDGSASTQLTLPPGKHTLQLLFADHLHLPHEPPVHSEAITITVE